jgi:hypothetical protein
MITMNELQSISQLTPPVLTAYVNTGPVQSLMQPPESGFIRWLKKEAATATQNAPAREQELVKAQIARVEKFLRVETPRQKGVVILSSPGDWVVVPSDQSLENELHWGRPALSQLFWLVSAHKPYCIVTVDRTGARFFDYRFGEMTASGQMDFVVDVSQWKKKELGHVTGQKVQKTRGSQRDIFRHRMDAQFARMCRDVAEQSVKQCDKNHGAAIFLVGSKRLTLPIQAAFSRQFQRPIVVFDADLKYSSLPELQKRLGPRINDWDAQRQEKMVKDLVGENRTTVVGFDETLTLLEKGKIRTLVLGQQLDQRLQECSECGWIDRSSDPVCPQCKRERHAVNLREVLPELAWQNGTEVEIVTGRAAELLRKSGGMGGWLRGRTQAELR